SRCGLAAEEVPAQLLDPRLEEHPAALQSLVLAYVHSPHQALNRGLEIFLPRPVQRGRGPHHPAHERNRLLRRRALGVDEPVQLASFAFEEDLHEPLPHILSALSSGELVRPLLHAPTTLLMHLPVLRSL